VAAVARRQAQLQEDVADVLVHGAFGNDEGLADGGVVVVLGHELQHLALARGERVQRESRRRARSSATTVQRGPPTATRSSASRN
jgi:hypothetical protein